MNKKGGAEEIFIITIVGIILVVFFAGWIYGHGIITDILVNIETQEGQPNVSLAAQSTIAFVDQGIQTLRLIAFTIFFGMVLAFLIINVFIKQHPFLYFVYVMVGMLSVILSVYISNFYEDLFLAEGIGQTIQSFTIMNFVMAYLPIIIGAVSIFGAILLFINLPRDGGLTGEL